MVRATAKRMQCPAFSICGCMRCKRFIMKGSKPSFRGFGGVSRSTSAAERKMCLANGNSFSSQVQIAQKLRFGTHAIFRPEPWQKHRMRKGVDGLYIGPEPHIFAHEVIQNRMPRPIGQPGLSIINPVGSGVTFSPLITASKVSHCCSVICFFLLEKRHVRLFFAPVKQIS